MQCQPNEATFEMHSGWNNRGVCNIAHERVGLLPIATIVVAVGVVDIHPASNVAKDPSHPSNVAFPAQVVDELRL